MLHVMTRTLTEQKTREKQIRVKLSVATICMIVSVFIAHVVSFIHSKEGENELLSIVLSSLMSLKLRFLLYYISFLCT